MSALRHGGLLVTAALLFAAGALVGLCFAVLGPVPLVRLLGATALVAGLMGCGVQVYALRELHPRAYRWLARRVRATIERSGSRTVSHAPGVPATA